jgi:hypothetical protein
VAPTSKTFETHVHQFAAVCRVTNQMKRMTVGAIGARTTAFKTVRFDELTLQRLGIVPAWSVLKTCKTFWNTSGTKDIAIMWVLPLDMWSRLFMKPLPSICVSN